MVNRLIEGRRLVGVEMPKDDKATQPFLRGNCNFVLAVAVCILDPVLSLSSHSPAVGLNSGGLNLHSSQCHRQSSDNT